MSDAELIERARAMATGTSADYNQGYRDGLDTGQKDGRAKGVADILAKVRAALATPVVPIYNTPEYQRGVTGAKKMISHLLELGLTLEGEE